MRREICSEQKNKIKTSDKTLNETDSLPDKEFKVRVIKIHTKLGRRMDKHSENFNKKTESIRNYQTEVTELKNTISKPKNTLEGFNSGMDEAEEWISKLEDKTMELT